MFTTHVSFTRYDRSVARTQQMLSDGMRVSVVKAAKKGAMWARTHHKHKRRTGKLTSKAHLYAKLDYASHQRASASFVNTDPKARFVEYPTRAHVIRPKAGHGFVGPLRRGQSRRAITDIGTHRVALRFRIGGRVIFRRKVFHPGTPGFPFMRPAAKPAAEELHKSMGLVIGGISRTIWKV